MHFQGIKLCTKKLTHLSVFMSTSILLHIVVVVIVRSKTLFVVFLDPYFYMLSYRSEPAVLYQRQIERAY